MAAIVPCSDLTVQNVHVSYGFIKPKAEILKGINLNVDQGTIYGLLGPSGCGKTTLLKCIVGKIYPDNGSIMVFGKTPGLLDSKIPGSGIGYMPQELALYQELSIEETLNYYGCFHQMKDVDIKDRIVFLVDLLNLPNKGRFIQHLSGGQKRRVSFAIALFHEAPLLILDEPTVGVDPLLRETIWQHLLDLCINEKVTIIVTTHYIEEARQANKIGLMRNGKILIEEIPSILLQRYNLPTLESVYLQLCKQDDTEQIEATSQRKHSNLRLQPNESNSHKKQVKPGWKEYFVPLNLRRVKGLLRKNFLRMQRNKALMFFQLIIPVIAVVAFFTVVDGVPNHIPIAVCNEDWHFGTDFLEQLNKDQVVQIPVNSEEEGLAMVINGDAAGLIHIRKEFTSGLIRRVNAPRNVSKDIISAGSIHLRLDYTHQQISLFLQKSLVESLLHFAQETIGELEKFPQILITMFEAHDPIYGTSDRFFITEYIGAGLLLVLVNLMPLGLTALLFVTEKRSGILHRAQVSGVTSLEIMFGYMISQLGVVIGQVALVMFLAIVAFKLYVKGSIILVILVSMLQALQGMTFGFCISVVCSEERSAIILAISFFFCNLLLSGTVWPLKAAPVFIESLSQFLPLTLAVDSMRWIILRGKDLTFISVWLGMLATVSWMFIFIILAIISMRFKQ